MKRLGRLRFCVYVALTLLVLLGGARLVLSSAYAADKVAGRLSAVLGVPVRVGGVDIAPRSRGCISSRPTAPVPTPPG